MAPQRIASVAGFREPAANGAMVNGMSAAEIRRSKVQWYEPWVGSVAGIGTGSLAGENVRRCHS